LALFIERFHVTSQKTTQAAILVYSWMETYI